jgi:AraC-like DNA-binding protein
MLEIPYMRRNSLIMVDPLSDVLELLGAHSLVSAGFKAGGAWTLRVPSFRGLKFNAVLKGEARLLIDGHADPIALRRGDCFMLSRGTPFVLASDLSLPTKPAEEVFTAVSDGLAMLGSGDDFHVVGGKMILDEMSEPLLTGELPDCVLLRRDSDSAKAVQWLLGRFVKEIEGSGAGSGVVAGSLMHLMFIELVRAHLSSCTDGMRPGWMDAQRDDRIGKALGLIHAEPVHPWTLAELADECAMSRSSFAERFRRMVGITALDYVVRWRMQLARRDLALPAGNLSLIAERYGYSSVSAFCHAFKRVFGTTPGQLRSRRN